MCCETMDRNHTVVDHRGEVISSSMIDVDWIQVRRTRDRALAASDWRALKDVTLSNAWKEYRQALRDLPQDHAEANNAADHWPVMPDA